VHIAPARFTSRAGARNRVGKIYVDFQRNRAGATAVAAYSPRLRTGAPVSMPVRWDALGKVDLRGTHFNLRNAATHLEGRDADPWAGYTRVRQRLTAAMLARVRKLHAAG
jgi:bifunctional non-homologous end joining protein LigD